MSSKATMKSSTKSQSSETMITKSTKSPKTTTTKTQLASFSKSPSSSNDPSSKMSINCPPSLKSKDPSSSSTMLSSPQTNSRPSSYPNSRSSSYPQSSWKTFKTEKIDDPSTLELLKKKNIFICNYSVSEHGTDQDKGPWGEATLHPKSQTMEWKYGTNLRKMTYNQYGRIIEKKKKEEEEEAMKALEEMNNNLEEKKDLSCTPQAQQHIASPGDGLLWKYKKPERYSQLVRIMSYLDKSENHRVRQLEYKYNNVKNDDNCPHTPKDDVGDIVTTPLLLGDEDEEENQINKTVGMDNRMGNNLDDSRDDSCKDDDVTPTVTKEELDFDEAFLVLDDGSKVHIESGCLVTCYFNNIQQSQLKEALQSGREQAFEAIDGNNKQSLSPTHQLVHGLMTVTVTTEEKEKCLVRVHTTESWPGARYMVKPDIKSDKKEGENLLDYKKRIKKEHANLGFYLKCKMAYLEWASSIPPVQEAEEGEGVWEREQWEDPRITQGIDTTPGDVDHGEEYKYRDAEFITRKKKEGSIPTD